MTFLKVLYARVVGRGGKSKLLAGIFYLLVSLDVFFKWMFKHYSYANDPFLFYCRPVPTSSTPYSRRRPRTVKGFTGELDVSFDLKFS